MTETLARSSYGTFTVEKSTGTHADVLAAVGLADLLADQVGDTHVQLRDGGGSIVVQSDSALTDAALEALRVGSGFPYLRPKSRDPVPSGVIDIIDYEEQRDKAKRYAEAQRALREARGKKLADDPDLLATLQDSPREDWRLGQVMYLLSNHASPNRLHAALVANPEKARRDVAAALHALALGEAASTGWKVDAVQLFNPMAAKGYARLKPDSTDRNDKTKEQWTDAFAEWLRYRGYFKVACPFFQGSKGEHIRVYSPIPANVSLAWLKSAAAELRRAGLWGGAPKLDALAVIWLAQYLIQSSDEGRATSPDAGMDILGFSLADKTPADVIGGLAITHYQSLGNARAVATIATLALPGWFPIHSPDDARAWLEILDEHRRVIRGLDDSHSDEIGLLIGYRRFLERRGRAAFGALLDFMGGYGPFLVRAWDAKRRVRVFRTTNFRRLVEGMAPEFTSIVADPGFEAVAKAVRRATVQAQFLKSNGVKDIREIRYDLLPELRRARGVPDSKLFVEVVSDFVARYNAENARRRETKKPAQANVHTDEFASFLRLVDDHGANVVGALLCAYGTCVEPREVGDAGAGGAVEEPEASTSENVENLPNDTAESEG